MSVIIDDATSALSIEVQGKQRTKNQADSLNLRAARRGFYPGEGVSVLVRDKLAKVGSEVQLVLDGKVIATHTLKSGEAGTGIRFSVGGDLLPHGVHVLCYQVEQKGVGLRQSPHQASLRVKTMPPSHLGFEVDAGEDHIYASIDVSFETCVSTQKIADDVFRFTPGFRQTLFSPDGKFMFASAKSVNKIDLETRKIVQRYSPEDMYLGGFSASEKLLYLASGFKDNIYILDVESDRLEMGAYVGTVRGLVVSHDAKQLFVVGLDEGLVKSSLIFVNAESQEVVNRIAVGNVAVSIALNPLRDEVYVGCLGVRGEAQGVFAVNTSNGNVRHIPAESPWNLALSPNGQELYAFGGDSITVIDTVSNGVKKTVEMHVRSLTLSADGELVYCYNYEGSFVSVYDARSWSLVRDVEIPIDAVRALSTQKDNGDIWAMYG
ncbi:YncE family protein [Pseudomonas sp. SCPG-7]|uniref:YncE family protein n=1 Tax=Pseudomonas sp. SCPG-7 TaxID=1961714 RepID=UPI000A38E648|nr:YncE family protein [Pseudomonas sp. SCPG-7]